jgi:heme oxygenase
MTGTADPTGTEALSVRLRAGTRAEHDAAEGDGFLSGLAAGRLPRAAYANLVAQHFFIYESLESAAQAMADDPVAGVFVFPELTRLPSLIADLEFLYGPDWADRIAAVPATASYCARLRSVAFDQPPAFLAHHYTRYLGDLSGGQHIGRAVADGYGFAADGWRFFQFDGVDPGAFRSRYRAQLDAVSWQPGQEQQFLAEVTQAYRLNVAVLHELGQRCT